MGVELLGYMITLHLTVEKLPGFFKWLWHFTFLLAVNECFSMSLQTLAIVFSIIITLVSVN